MCLNSQLKDVPQLTAQSVLNLPPTGTVLLLHLSRNGRGTKQTLDESERGK